MCGFVGLAIDLGLIATVRTQTQNAADAAAMAGARALNGLSGQNMGSTTTTGTAGWYAMQTATANPVMGGLVPSADVTITFGAYHYDTTNQLFTPVFPDSNGNLPAGDNFNMCQVVVSYPVNVTFAGVFQIVNPSFNDVTLVVSSSIAAHRPRDVALILDYSGSMNNEGDLWNAESYLDNGQTNVNNGYVWPKGSNPNLTSNNLETVYPQFGPYANGNNYADYTSYPNLLCPTSGSAPSNFMNTPTGTPPALPGGAAMIGRSNVSQSALGVPAMVGDYFSYSGGAIKTGSSAFSSQPDSYATSPGGDNYLQTSGGTAKTWTSPAGNTYSTTVATTVNDVLNSTTINTNWESFGYKGGGGSTYKDVNGNVVTTFNGYTVGPRYWGKTFFMWPPDPTNDWRKNFFFETDGITPMDDNTMMFTNAFPGYLDPPGNYVINYKNILAWIKNTGTNPFPPQMQSGQVQFYSSIPTDITASASNPYNHSNPNHDITDPDQRFWKEYIDWVLGVWRDPQGAVQHTQSPSCSVGPDFVFGTVSITAKPSVSNPADLRYMNYTDNVWRPRHRMWFGPMTMIQFMADTGKFPGTAHDISMYPMKSGVGAALQDIQNNHPNDKVALLPFHRPQFSNDPVNNGGFNNPQYNLNNNYTAMINSLWLPNITSGMTVPPWDGWTAGVNIPRAHGDWNSNTSTSYGFMLAYNQFSSATTLQGTTPPVGGFGRKGATRLVIYETDGMANEDSIATGGNTVVNNNSDFVTGSPAPYNSYFAILPGQTVNSGGYSQTNVLAVVECICNKDNGTSFRALPTTSPYPSPQPAVPGFATASKPVIVHCIAFGAIFETQNSASTAAVPLLQQISTIGGTVFPAASTPTSAELAADPTTPYKWCIGSLSQRRALLEKAIVAIFDSSVPVSVIQ
jgi:hypothetical protein